MKNVLVIALLLSLIVPAAAFETDQYNLPPTPLADIGDEVADYTRENIEKAIAKVNARIEAAKSPEEAARLRDPAVIVKEVYKLLGGGIPPFTNSGTWMEKHEFKAQPARYKAPFGESIHRTAPLNQLTISPTVKIYGSSFGTDKIAHIFQQGFTYYSKIENAKKRGADEKTAIAKAVKWGRFTEQTYYGFLVSAIWSNADLAANFAGWKFYESLTRETRIGETVVPPVLVLKEGRWVFRDGFDAHQTLLKPFISDHLNEALNPSIFVNLLGFRSVVRSTVEKKACPEWRLAYPEATRATFSKLRESLKRWQGDDYGHRESDKTVLIEKCFLE